MNSLLWIVFVLQSFRKIQLASMYKLFDLGFSMLSLKIPFSVGFWWSLESLAHILVLVFSFLCIGDYCIIGVPVMPQFFYVQYGVQQCIHQLKGILAWQFLIVGDFREVHSTKYTNQGFECSQWIMYISRTGFYHMELNRFIIMYWEP